MDDILSVALTLARKLRKRKAFINDLKQDPLPLIASLTGNLGPTFNLPSENRRFVTSVDELQMSLLTVSSVDDFVRGTRKAPSILLSLNVLDETNALGHVMRAQVLVVHWAWWKYLKTKFAPSLAAVIDPAQTSTLR